MPTFPAMNTLERIQASSTLPFVVLRAPGGTTHFACFKSGVIWQSRNIFLQARRTLRRIRTASEPPSRRPLRAAYDRIITVATSLAFKEAIDDNEALEEPVPIMMLQPRGLPSERCPSQVVTFEYEYVHRDGIAIDFGDICTQQGRRER